MRDQLRALAKLAKMDEAAKDFDEELKTLPQRIEAMRQDVDTLEKLLVHERSQLEEAQKLKQMRVDELSEQREALARAKAKASRARTMKEADAAEREVEANRRAIGDREKEIATLQETVETKTATLEQRESQFEEAQDMFRKEAEAAKKRLAEVQALRGEVVVGRDEEIAKLPRRLVKRYGRLRERSKYAPVSIVSDGTCEACQMALPPQLFIEIQRGERASDSTGDYTIHDFYTCPQCHAFLVYHGLVADVLPRTEAEEAGASSAEAGAEATS